MQASMASATKPHLMKDCLTSEKIAKGLDVGEHDPSHCQTRIVSNTPSDMEVHVTCHKPNGDSALDEHFHMKGAEALDGTIQGSMSASGKAMSNNTTIHGKWLGASCGDVKDFQMEK
jgi:hypothetical protein